MLKRSLTVILCVLLLIPSFILSAAAETKTLYKGADVSAWQYDIDWKTYKSKGMDFAILRCYSHEKDKYFDKNYAEASANGVYLGAYVYMYATTEKEAKAEAEAVLDTLGGRRLTFPLFLDVEDSSVVSLGKSAVTKLMLTELCMFEEAGYNAGIYTSKIFTDQHMDMTSLSGYDLWIAKWIKSYDGTYIDFADEDPHASYAPLCDMWQFTDGGDSAYYGASGGRLDLNFCYTDYISGSPYPYNDPRHYPTPEKAFASGTTGENAAWLQAMLWQFGYAIAIDGSFGNKTKTAVMDYQTRSGLTADGSVGPLTRARLNDDFADLIEKRGECSHKPEAILGKRATCTEPGLSDGYVCSECGMVLSGQQEISPLGHDFGADGVCTRCGYSEGMTVTVLLGDVNCDDTVNSKDVSSMLKVMAGWSVMPFNSKAADYNRDGNFNVQDIVAMMRMIAAA